MAGTWTSCCTAFCLWTIIAPGSIFALLDETTVMWTEKGYGGEVAVRGIQGDPDVWTKEGVKNTFVSQPLFGSSLYNSHRMALSFRYADREVFFSDVTYKEIYKLKFANTTRRPFRYNSTLEAVYSGTSVKVYGLAVDWMTGVIYWTDALYNWVSMAQISNPQYYRHVVVTGLDIPVGVAVHPHQGYLFWTDYGAKSKIERSRTDGSERKAIIVNTDLVKPMGITIDYEESMLYWVDDGKNTIEMSDFNGQQRKAIKLSEVTSRKYFLLFGIGIYKNYVFITDQMNLDIQVYDKKNFTTVTRVRTQLSRPYDILVYDPSRQPGAAGDSCQAAGCAQLCFSMGEGRVRCDCGVGFQLNTDGKSCRSKLHKMPEYIYTIGERLCATSVNLPDTSLTPRASDIFCFLRNLSHVQALAVHSHAQFLFYSDTADRQIVRVRMDLDKGDYTEKEVLADQTGSVRGLAVDYSSNNLYWADEEYNHIMVSRLDGRFPAVVIEGADSPRAVVLDVPQRVMYWSSKNAIKRANLDGSNITNFMTYKVKNPDGMYFDPVFKRLYWCNRGSKPNITHVQTNDTRYQLSVSASAGVKAGWTFRDVTVFQDYLAWTDGKGGVHFAENKLEPGKTYRRTVNHADVNVSHDIILYDTSLQPIVNKSACDDENGGCDHICMPKSNTARTCLCGIGFTLDTDNKSCVSTLVKEDFLLFTDPYHKQVYQMNLAGSTPATPQGLRLRDLNSPRLVEFDQSKQLLYWVEFLTTGHYIKRADLNGESEKIFSNFERDSPIGDLIAFNNKLYYTVSGHIIEIDLNTNKVTPFYERGTVFPGSLSIDRNSGTLYWATKGSVQIFKADLCAPQTTQQVISISINRDIAGLTITGQPPTKAVIWSNTTMWEVDMVTGSYRVLLNNTTYNFSTAGYWQGSLFITMWNQREIYKLVNGQLEKFSKPLFSRIMSLKSYGKRAHVKSNCLPTTTSSGTSSTTTSSTTSSTTTSTTTTTMRSTTTTPRTTTTTKLTSTTVESLTTSAKNETQIGGVVPTGDRPDVESGNLNSHVGEAASELTGTKVFILAGVSVAAFFIVVIVLTIVYLTVCRKKRRRRKSSTTPAVHFQSDSHDNPTYDVLPVPRVSVSMETAGASGGVSFEELPPKGVKDLKNDEMVDEGELPPKCDDVVDEMPSGGGDGVESSDRAHLVKEDEENNKAVDYGEVVFTVADGNSYANAAYNSNVAM